MLHNPESKSSDKYLFRFLVCHQTLVSNLVNYYLVTTIFWHWKMIVSTYFFKEKWYCTISVKMYNKYS